MKIRLALAAALSLGLSAPFASANDTMAGDLKIMHPFAFASPKMAQAGAGFMTIENTGDTDDILLEVRADFPRVQVHSTQEKNGIARMMHVENLPIPAGETVEFAPGGFHVMFMGLSAPLEKGQTIPATLVFENAGEREIMFVVKERPEGGKSMDHSGH